jgi:hypothetical protein
VEALVLLTFYWPSGAQICSHMTSVDPVGVGKALVGLASGRNSVFSAAQINHMEYFMTRSTTTVMILSWHD